ncbi:MAG TPA: hypothetical protein VFH51_20555, partial [Myxococcota bacterium]|nr:hypothetical protein [Myxococcota bacterium]
KLLSRKDDTRMHVDIYFTPEGVERLGRVDEGAALVAYAQAMAVLDASRAGHPLAEEGAAAEGILAQLDAVARLDRMWWWTPSQRREASALTAGYRHRYGRDVHRDATLLAGGRACWRHFERLRAGGATADPGVRATLISGYFISLGEAMGARFAPAAATLARLVGPHGMVVHKLALSGAGLAIRGSEARGLPDPTDPLWVAPGRSGREGPLTLTVIWA